MSQKTQDDKTVWDLFKEQMLIGPARDKFNRFEFPVQKGEQSLLAAQWYLSGLYSFAVCRSYIQFAWPTKDEIIEEGGEKLTTHIKKIQSQQAKWIKNHLTDDLPYLKKTIQESFTGIVGINKLIKNNDNKLKKKKKKKKNRKRKKLSDNDSDNDNDKNLTENNIESEIESEISSQPPKKKKKKSKSRSKSPKKVVKKVDKTKIVSKKRNKAEPDEDIDINNDSSLEKSEKNNESELELKDKKIKKKKKKKKKNILHKKIDNDDNESNDSNNDKNDKKIKKNKKKTEYYVRRCRSGWDFFRQEFSEKHKNDYVGKNIGSVCSDASKVWKLMKNDEKKKYELLHEKDKLLIEKAKKQFDNGYDIDKSLLKKYTAKQIQKKINNEEKKESKKQEKLNKKKKEKTKLKNKKPKSTDIDMDNIIIEDSDNENNIQKSTTIDTENDENEKKDTINEIDNDIDLFSSQPPDIDAIKNMEIIKDNNNKINDIDIDNKNIEDEMEEDSEESSASLNLG